MKNYTDISTYRRIGHKQFQQLHRYIMFNKDLMIIIIIRTYLFTNETKKQTLLSYLTEKVINLKWETYPKKILFTHALVILTTNIIYNIITTLTIRT